MTQMKPHSVRFLPVLVSTILFGSALGVSASPTITLSATTSEPSSPQTYNLSAAGTTDWVQFGVSGSSSGFSLTNEKSGGSVGGVDTVGAVTLSNDPYTHAGVQTSSPQYVSYTDGTSPASSGTTISGTPAGEYSIQTLYSTNNSQPATGATLSFTIDFNQALGSGNIYVVGNSYAVPEALLTATLSNGNTETATEGYGASNQNDIFDIGLANITQGSSLSISWEVESMVGSGNDAYGNVSLNGVALELVPEPSTYALMLGGLALLGFCVRRRLGVGAFEKQG